LESTRQGTSTIGVNEIRIDRVPGYNYYTIIASGKILVARKATRVDPHCYIPQRPLIVNKLLPMNIFCLGIIECTMVLLEQIL
jgi:hypothetical protein